jgi:ATP/maltotriose-dependent transcriptional regulator MalT
MVAREIGDIMDTTCAMMLVGAATQVMGDPQKADAIFEEAVALARSHQEHEPRTLYIALFWLGQFASLKGDNDHALTIYEEGLEFARRQGDWSFIAVLLAGLGRALIGKNNFERSTAILLEGIQTCRKLDYHETTAYCLDFLGQIAWFQGEKERAARLLGAAAALRTRIGVANWLPDPNYAQIAADLSEDTLRSAQSLFQDLSTEQIITLALNPETLQVQTARQKTTAPASPPGPLTLRELEIAALITQGIGNREIGEKNLRFQTHRRRTRPPYPRQARTQHPCTSVCLVHRTSQDISSLSTDSPATTQLTGSSASSPLTKSGIVLIPPTQNSQIKVPSLPVLPGSEGTFVDP